MPKGIFTQAAVILAERPPGAHEVTRALGSFEIGKHLPPGVERNWMGTGYETWTLAMDRAVNGAVLVDVIDRAWPDDMGDPKGDVMLFGAWTMSHMGPFTWPGGLARAAQMTRATGRDELADRALAHRALVRIRSSYVLGGDDEARILPPGYDPLSEMKFVTNVALAVLEACGDEGACYFNPAGETLATRAEALDLLTDAEERDLPALPLWVGHRFVAIDGWMVADALGMEQLDALDHEASFPEGSHDLGEVVNFLRSVALYTYQKGAVIRTGETSDGPGGRWRAVEVKETVIPGPRPAVRWFPPDAPEPPPALRRTGSSGKVPPPPPQTASGRTSLPDAGRRRPRWWPFGR